jgi:hypothetical protein
MDVGVCGSLLVIVIPPLSLPAVVGEYVRFKLTLALGISVIGVVIPETANGPPFTVIREIVRFVPPILLTIAVPLPMFPTVMVPKFMFAGFKLICCGAGVAVPDSATCSDETPASVMTDRVPVTLPDVLGLNET